MSGVLAALETLDRLDGLAWSAVVHPVTGDTVPLAARHDAEVARPVASLGKVLLLVELARRIGEGDLTVHAEVAPDDTPPVGDSGLWQHLTVASLPLGDVAALVACVSDNRATNAALAVLGDGDPVTGLAAVARTARRLGLRSTVLHDRVRDARGPQHPPVLATGTADELVRVFADLAPGADGPPIDDALAVPGVAARVRVWLQLGVDASMVAGGFDLDPLVASGDGELVLAHKTGVDPGVRAEAGLVAGPRGALAYAVLITWDPDERDHRRAVRRAMTAVGEQLADHLRGAELDAGDPRSRAPS